VSATMTTAAQLIIFFIVVFLKRINSFLSQLTTQTQHGCVVIFYDPAAMEDIPKKQAAVGLI